MSQVLWSRGLLFWWSDDIIYLALIVERIW